MLRQDFLRGMELLQQYDLAYDLLIFPRQLPAAIENGRRAGMISFTDSLSALVREGVVHPSHAYRKAPSRDQLVAALHRDGVDSSIAERLG